MTKHPCISCVYFNQCGSTTRTEQCKGRETKMMICRTKKKNGVGEVSSKYGYDRDGSKFESDIKAHQERNEALYESFVQWMKAQDVRPDQLRYMFIRYYEEFIN